ncbi:hypothetical protein Rumeso_04727 [Rubellimicrobium mesophilum DSM 19309]|uniref:DUF2059 domain-containing protein n=1 Tax=Rubellimicrobium mesophilum DSM 19309 TaxID=442562 RepID=A0A017HGY9_9RHOB|nr:hypothetical protein [Rubellimicrobium mesophilum]EYD73606.1 hypothetical protein Rumeso_04727 [Rubellimicrobium mesophilum DSM 19309]
MILRTASILAVALTAVPALAQTSTATTGEVPDDVRAIYDALLLPEVIDVVAEEGASHGEDLARTVFEGRPVPQHWTDLVAAIYDPGHMEQEVLASLAEDLRGQDTAAMLAFLQAEPGRSLTALELDAREAMMDEEVEQEAKERAAVALFQNSPRLEILQRYAEATDLIEMNVAGTMNNNVAYLTGLLDGGALSDDMTESDLLADVAGQEPQIRAQTEEWAYSFLLKAYEPATDADIEALIAFSETEPGQALNLAVFEAFDERFTDVSRALGLAAARYMTTEEI